MIIPSKGDAMSKNFERMQEDLELILNEIAADQKVFRVTLQCFLLNMAEKTDPAIIEHLKRQVLGSIQQTLPAGDPEEAQGAERSKQLSLVRAEELFREIQTAVGLKAPTIPPSEKN